MKDPAARFGREPLRSSARAAKPFESARSPERPPDGAPFSRFLDRDHLRQKRDRRRRLTLIVSLGIHIVVLIGVVGYSVFQVDELFSPSVEVKILRTSKLPPGVVTPLTPSSTPKASPLVTPPR